MKYPCIRGQPVSFHNQLAPLYKCLLVFLMYQARDTVKRYDDATGSLHQALREQQEIEKRSNDICVELVAATENLVTLKAEVKDIERKKSRQEKLLREINNVSYFSIYFPFKEDNCLVIINSFVVYQILVYIFFQSHNFFCYK